MEVEVVHFCFWDWMFECLLFFFFDGSFLRVSFIVGEQDWNLD